VEPETLGIAADDTPLPDVHDADSYIAARVKEQIERFYRPRAALYTKRVRRLTSAGSLLAGLAVLLSALGGAFGWSGAAAWVPVVTTITTALAAHGSASRYEELIMEYLNTAKKLEELCLFRRAADLPDAAFIEACELVMAAENKGWKAGWNALGSQSARPSSGS
jgi:hypothetical protein